MATDSPINLWTSPDHARDYLERADSISHRTEGEAALLEFIPADAHRILDLGTGDGRLLALVQQDLAKKNSSKPSRPPLESLAIDFSPPMLDAARQRFAEDSSVTVLAHNLDEPLTGLSLPSTDLAGLDLASLGLAGTGLRHLGLESLSFKSLGKFDAVISCFAIHHVVDERKRALYAEIYDLLNPHPRPACTNNSSTASASP